MSRSDKGKAIHGLEKIPDIVLLKQANIEIGQLKSYIQELEDKIKMFESFKENKNIVLNNGVNKLLESNKTLKESNKKLKRDNESLLENLLKERRLNKSNL